MSDSLPDKTAPVPLHVIIVGAGIAGLTLAIALRKEGHHVEIFEKSKFSQDVGVAIAMGPNAMRSLLSLGLDPQKARGVNLLHWFSKDKPEGDPDAITSNNAEEIYGAPHYFFHRVDLHAELLKLATAEDPGASTPVQIHLGSTVISCDPQNATIALRDGQVVHGDLVVGADGINSSIRKSILGKEINPHPSGLSTFRTVIPFNAVPNAPSSSWLTTIPKGFTFVRGKDSQDKRHLLIYPCRDGGLLNVTGSHIDERTNSEMLNTSSSSSAEEWLETFSDFAPRYLEFIKLATNVSIWPLLIWDELPTWTNERSCIIGDAAHAMFPMLGQGGAQGVEDAIFLAALLPLGTSNDTSVLKEQLELFEGLRKPRASKVQDLSNRMGRGLPRVRIGEFCRTS
ncbi:FAD/NAD(P)-binding domain-containing protein [Sistotremastrum suecicum HHB10207 ss-3]|uniref:FAD/NAD(P)-binding domain-containing protein n=1 Tax=Sistotremastrum suecicum HHB10207 ss-3 TaxID=1314776 RepID=A0A166B8Y1_9AGAM|nr:FAD/NAD(P)-binding domain-containing protein [Sistotremastrum suecicum HHB10207 ss-3]